MPLRQRPCHPLPERPRPARSASPPDACADQRSGPGATMESASPLHQEPDARSHRTPMHALLESAWCPSGTRSVPPQAATSPHDLPRLRPPRESSSALVGSLHPWPQAASSTRPPSPAKPQVQAAVAASFPCPSLLTERRASRDELRSAQTGDDSRRRNGSSFMTKECHGVGARRAGLSQKCITESSHAHSRNEPDCSD